MRERPRTPSRATKACRAALIGAWLLTACASGSAPQSAAPAGGGSEILWDRYGVPHIFARDRNALAYAWGWAQMRNHGDLLLRLYAQGRGRAAEFLGAAYLEEDRWVHTMGVPQRSPDWLSAQNAEMRAHISSFVRGINDFAAAHPEFIGDSLRAVLPVRETDVMGHAQRWMMSAFVTSLPSVTGGARRWQQRGSNAWAIAPSRSASGHALLLANPHLPWGDLFTFMEAQLAIPGADMYGAALIGSPVLQIAFNDRLGWTHTVNTQDGEDLYELTLASGGYEWDGGTRSFEQEQHVLQARDAGGALRPDTLLIRRSVHGPVVAVRDGKALAVRAVGATLPHALEQWWRMATARNYAEFEAAIRPNQISSQNITYADADGRIMYFYGGNTPVRAVGDRAYWSGIVPGTTSQNLWTSLHSFGDMPLVLDPPTGWVQNANNPPWWTTFPVTVDRSRYPAYLASIELSLRAQKSAALVEADASMTLEEMIGYKHSTELELANRMLPALFAAARQPMPEGRQRGIQVLERWDRRSDSASVGAVLFMDWATEYTGRLRGRSPFAEPWNAARPRETPRGLSDTAAALAALEASVQRVESRYGSAAVRFGDVYRVRRDGVDLPSNGAPQEFGVFRFVGYRPAGNDRFVAASGDSYVAAIEFGPTVRARSLIGYGNASRAGSPHRTDQLALFAGQQLRPVWRSRADIERNLSVRERFR